MFVKVFDDALSRPMGGRFDGPDEAVAAGQQSNHRGRIAAADEAQHVDQGGRAGPV